MERNTEVNNHRQCLSDKRDTAGQLWRRFRHAFNKYGSTPKKLVDVGSCGSGEWFSPSPFFRRLKGLRPKGEGGESGLRRKQTP